MILPRAVVYWDENLVPHFAKILDRLAAPQSSAHLLVTLYAGPVGDLELFDVAYCDVASPAPGCWSESA